MIRAAKEQPTAIGTMPGVCEASQSLTKIKTQLQSIAKQTTVHMYHVSGTIPTRSMNVSKKSMQ